MQQTDVFRRGAEFSTDEKARRAVKTFRSMQPGLSGFVRVLTGKSNARVELATHDNGSTDGTKIFYRPPIALGENHAHVRNLCDKRDTELQLRCPACNAREQVMSTIYHEIAHICFDSFQKVSQHDQDTMLDRALSLVDPMYTAVVSRRVRMASLKIKESYMGIAGLMNEFLPLIENALEDARINQAMFTERVGTRLMFEANVIDVFSSGVEQNTSKGIESLHWRDAPLNAQVIVGLFLKASGYDFSTWLDQRVVEALADEQLTTLVGRIKLVKSVAGVYELSFPVLMRLRELGYCKSEMDPKPAPEPEPEPEAPELSLPNEGEGEPDNESEASDGEEGQDGEGDSADSASGEGDASHGESEAGEGEEGPERDVPDGGVADSSASGESESEDESEEGEADQPEDEHSEADADESGDASESAGDGTPDASGEEGSDGEASEAGEAGSGEDSFGPGSGAGSGGSEPADRDESATEGGSDRDDQSPDSGQDGDAGAVEEQRKSNSDTGQPTGGWNEYDADSSEADSGQTGSPAGDPSSDVSDGAVQAESSTESDGPLELPDVLDFAEGEREEPSDSDLNEPIDTGADDGTGGVEVKEEVPLPEGTATETREALDTFIHHKDGEVEVSNTYSDEKAVEKAIMQGMYFETPSQNVAGVRVHHYGKPLIVDGYNTSSAWDVNNARVSFWGAKASGVDGDFAVPESVIAPGLLRMRVAFAANAKGNDLKHLKSGKVNGRVLGRRAALGDPRLFRKRTLPGKRNYLVVIGMDISGSTMGLNIVLMKRAVMAQATMCDRFGIPFAIYAHSGSDCMDIYSIKEEHEPWNPSIQKRLVEIGSDSANFDGHALEYLRKRADESSATDVVILYYSDGKMPAANHDEELEILQREIKTCAKKGYTLLGVGIRTDSPARHGLPTVQVDDDSDLVKPVVHLERALRQSSAR